MTPKITDEQREALQQNLGRPVAVEDARTRERYILVGESAANGLLEEWLHGELQIGFEQSDAGLSRPWDIQRTLAEAHRRGAEG